jgi:hypothetical protein
MVSSETRAARPAFAWLDEHRRNLCPNLIRPQFIVTKQRSGNNTFTPAIKSLPMKTHLYILPLFYLALCSAIQAQTAAPLPDKLATLRSGYEAAVARATIPITQTYIKELQKLKADYTRAGNLEAALAADAILKQALAASPQVVAKVPTATKLSQMTIEDFKDWLRTVTIVETNGEKTTFEFDGTSIVSSRPSAPTPRNHKDTEVEIGVISVPFSTDIAVIRVSDNLRSATVRYDEKPQLEAKIRPKK